MGAQAVLVFASMAWAAPGHAQMPGIPQSLKDACVQQNVKDVTPNNQFVDVGHSIRFCDDGVPPSGGTTPNETGKDAVKVPARYARMEGGFGLPAMAADAASMPGADTGGNISLDVDVTMPTTSPPSGGYPLLVFMHGCCGGAPGIVGGDKTDWETPPGGSSFPSVGGDRGNGYQEQWHYNNAWFASRGYVVVNYTARGFVGDDPKDISNPGTNLGSTGETQLDSRNFEIHDFQYLACELAADQDFHVDPSRLVVTGGSYGGGFSWLALTNPIWSCPGGSPGMKLAAVAPLWGWTDLTNSLVPTGRHSTDPGRLPAFDGSDSSVPTGIAKASLLGALYQNGKSAEGAHAAHTTFPAYLDDAFTCLNSADPLETNPGCKDTFAKVLPSFVHDRSAYYQNHWFRKIRTDPSYRVPVFSAGGLSDPLFPSVEHLRMANRILSEVPDYPIQQYFGDYMHFVQNKAREWADVCGTDHHECYLGDYPNGDLNATPNNLVRQGANSRLTSFIDHYARPGNDSSQPEPKFDVTASLQICPQNAAQEGVRANEPGDTYTAPSFAQLAPHDLDLHLTGAQTTTSGVSDPHGPSDDPIERFLSNEGVYSPFAGSQSGTSLCAVDNTPAGPGVATYDSEPLAGDATMIGATKVSIDYAATGTLGNYQLDARLYDVFPDGTAVMVDRGARRVIAPNGTVTYELNGNAWRFRTGHKVRIEVAQDTKPTYRTSNVPSSTTISGVHLAIPVREGQDRPSVTPPPPRGPVALPPLSWSAPARVNEGDGMHRVSCPSSSLCVAVDDAGNVVTSTDPPGGPGTWKVANVDPGNFLLSVSCPTESLCVAGDDAGNVVTSTDPTGGPGAWKVTRVDGGDYPYLNGLSCPTESLCVAVDASGNAFTTADPTGGASKWSAASIDGNGLMAVSCASENLCVAVDVAGNVVSSTNPRGGSGAWASAPVDVPAVLLGVSCPSTSLCVAVDASGNAVTSNDPAGGAGTWSKAAVDTGGNNALIGVACTSDRLCVAVDDAGNAVSSTNPTGGASDWRVANLGTEPLNGVSCSDASLCVAVDTRGHAVIGSGPRSAIGFRSQAGGAAACGAVDSFQAASARAAGRGLRFDLARTAGGPVDVRVYRETDGRRVIPSQLVARLTGRKRVIDWSGRASIRKRRVTDGYYVAALRAPSGRSTELRQLAFLRRHGRFSVRPAFATKLGCGVLGSFSLGKPVFGGSSSWPLSVHYKLRRKARVGITVARGKHVVRRLRTRTQSGGSHRVRLVSLNLRPGDYRVDLTVERDGTTTRHELFARRL